MLKNILLFSGILLAIFAVLLTILYMNQESVIFFPEKLRPDHQYVFSLPFEEVNYATEEGVTINALHFKANPSKGVILYFHGNAGSLRSWGYVAEDFVPLGWDLLIIDYRTYGKSTGKLSEEGFYHDAEFIYQQLLQSYSEDQIVVYGRSLGTGVAAKLAYDHHPAQLILETPFTNMKKLAAKLFPFLPVSLMLNYEFPTDQRIVQLKCPVHIIHGTEDEVIPYEEGKALSELIPQANSLFTIPGGHHNDLSNFPAFHQALQAIL